METKTEKLGIVNAIMHILKLDDAGKIEKFFVRQTKEAAQNASGIRTNMGIKKTQLEASIQKLEDKIEDAREAVKDAYTNVKVEDVATNADMESFSSKYWGKIRDAEDKVSKLEEELKFIKEKAGEEEKEDLAQIAKWESRIVKIKDFK